MSGRDRSKGWQFAKLNGHRYETTFCDKVKKGIDKEFNEKLMECVKKLGVNDEPVDCDSSSGKSMVDDIFGGKTQSKKDITVKFQDDKVVNFSIKKPSTIGGQVHLSTLSRFLDAMEIITGRPVPNEVKWVFRAFTGETEGNTIKEFTGGAKLHGPIIAKHNELAEIYQNRLYASTLEIEFSKKWDAFNSWFNGYMPEITRLLFSTGYCKNPEDFATILHYGNGCHFLIIDDLIKATKGREIYPSKHGYYKGSTLIMPWGFLEVHRPGKHEGPYQLQFHHNRDSILEIMETKK